MSNIQPEKDPLLSDGQMEDLLSAFYAGEEPEALKQLPSTWSQIQNNDVSEDLIVAPAKRLPDASRGIFVAVATLAMCVVVMIVWSGDDSGESTAQDKGQQTQEQQLNNTINVSGDGQSSGGGVIGDDSTTLEEIDNIDLTPQDDEPDGDVEKTDRKPESE